MVEIFLSIITRQAIRRGTFSSGEDVVAAIGNFVDEWNDRCQPFVWTKTADGSRSHNKEHKVSITGQSRTIRGQRVDHSQLECPPPPDRSDLALTEGFM